MAFKLRLTVHGVAACVPRFDANQFTVFLCQCDQPPTTAYVKFPEGSYTGNRPKVTKDGESYIVLSGEHLTIDANVLGEAKTLKPNTKKDPISSTPTAVDEKSLIWLPQIDVLTSGQGNINNRYFDDPLNAAPALVARLDIDRGELGTGGVERIQVPFKREREQKGTRRPVAREVVVEMNVDAADFTLKSTPIANGKSDGPKDMTFRLPDGKTELEIVIGNEARNDIFSPPPPITAIDVQEKEAAKEYRFYYSLCAVAPQDPVFPHVAARPGGETFCQPPLFPVRPGG